MKYEPADSARPHLAYTTDDDGIHYMCPPCGFDQNLGFYATVEEAIAARARHDWTDCDLRERGRIGP